MNDYVIIQGKIFYVSQYSMMISVIGSGIGRTLNATAYQDVVARKRSWSLTLEGDNTFYLRILAIFNAGGELSFTDRDGSNYTVLWSGDFAPVDESKEEVEHYSVSFQLQEK